MTNIFNTGRYLWLTLLALVIIPTANAQQWQAKRAHYSTEDGLPSDAIASLQQDNYGFVWIATWNGISRFDGYHFYNYKTGVSSGIRGMHNRVDGMTIDQSQNVWLKMYDGRIFVINRQTDRIEDPMEGISGHEDLRIDYFFTPYVTSTSDVLVSFGDAGLYKLRLDRNGLKQELIMNRNLSVNCIVEGYHNDIWVGTDQGVHRIDMSNLALERNGYFLDEHIKDLATNGYNIFAGTKSGKILQFAYGQEPTLVKDIGREITRLFIDSHGLIWFSDLGNGAYRLNATTGDVKFFNQHIPVPEFTSRGAEFGESMGTVWIRMNHGGYGYYNREADQVEYFHNDPVNPWNLCNTVNARLETNDGVVWESTIRRGLEKLEIMKNTIQRIQMVPGATSMLENETRAMYYDKDRHLLLIGNKASKLFLISDNGATTVLTHDSSGKPFGRFYGISKDSKGNYWLCDKDNGVYKMTPNGSGYTITNFCHQEGNKWSLTSNSAYQTVEDRYGNIWVATYGGGVNVIAKDKSGNYVVYNRQNELKRYPPKLHQRVRTVALDKEGNVWAGSTDGILMMTFHNNQFTITPLEAPRQMENGLASNDIVCLACDKHGNMWVGTNSGGLSCTTTKDVDGNWQFKNYGIEQGLPSEEIHSITFDNKGNVWFATAQVLCSFDTKKDILTTFSSLDGVDETMCSEGAALSMPNGNVLFGTFDGYYLVDRSKLVNKKGSLLKLHITDFLLDGQLQSPRLTSDFDYYVPESKRVEMPRHDCEFAFRFAALSYQLQHRVHYQYKLDGYDNDWHNADKTLTATYSGVPAGTYRFQVKAFLLESPENYDLRTIEVVIPPYFLLSASAIRFYLLLIAILACVLLWRYQEQLRKRFHQPAASEDTHQQAETTHNNEEKTDEYEIID
ncbi:MAG: hypothetical protein IJ200_03635 [Prevotella sp.]|nr:hypothetical protein [Prevotella sp.]